MRNVHWQKQAFKQLLAINRNQRITVVYAAAGLQNWPECLGVKRLSGQQDLYELRVGPDHIVFDIESDIHIMHIERKKQ